MTEIKICSKCRRSISPQEIADGLAVQRAGKWICPRCADIARKHKDPFQQDVLAALERLTNEVQNIIRTISYRESSIWTVFGAVAQVFVFFLLFAGYMSWTSKAGGMWLLAAVVCQVMAMNFFLLGK